MKKAIVITSIFAPTKAVKLFSKLKDYSLIVVGDKKSPKEYICDNAKFISVDEKLNYQIEAVLPYNHYSRKMIGYLYAMQNGARAIVDTDDDNLPYEDWAFPEFEGSFLQVPEGSGFVNVYAYYTKQKIWPRGLPLNLINKEPVALLEAEPVQIGFWQGLADGDPDVDAIYRLTDNGPCIFEKDMPPLTLGKNSICPFNTQNTICRSELFSLLYLPSTVTFRFTDILKGLVAQPIMWNYGYALGFVTANVFQERNEHDYMKDFESEIPCYLASQNVVDIVIDSMKTSANINENLFRAYENLAKHNIVNEAELPILEAWIKDVESLGN